MSHCALTYRDNCLQGLCHFISLTSVNGKRSTLNLSVNENGFVSIEEHSDYKNASLCMKHKHIAWQLVRKLNNGQIEMSKQTGEIPLINVTEQYKHYEDVITNLDCLEKCYQAYKKAKVLPPPFNASDYLTMIKYSLSYPILN